MGSDNSRISYDFYQSKKNAEENYKFTGDVSFHPGGTRKKKGNVYLLSRTPRTQALADTGAYSAAKMHCDCCYDEVILLLMSGCTKGHLFCNECVRRSSEEVIGQARTHIPCLSSDCNEEYPMAILRNILSPNTLSILERNLQQEEIRQANIEDLVSCPFCPFLIIMENTITDPVFRCQNPECLKESCRKCKEPNHTPLHCDQVKNTDMRTYVERKMAEAMIRTCWTCGKNFYKVEGCNMMTCPCGATMCYVCREPNVNYGHFGEDDGQCQSITDTYALHRMEVELASYEAKQIYEKEHPDFEETTRKDDHFEGLETDGNMLAAGWSPTDMTRQLLEGKDEHPKKKKVPTATLR